MNFITSKKRQATVTVRDPNGFLAHLLGQEWRPGARLEVACYGTAKEIRGMRRKLKSLAKDGT